MVDIDKLKSELQNIQRFIVECRDVGLDDFGSGEPDGADDFCGAIYDMEENVQQAIDSLETIQDEME